MATAAGRRQLFVYWRVRPDALEAAMAEVQALQQRLQDHHPGLVAQAFSRSDVDDRPAAPATIMETYAIDAAAAADGIDDALRLAIHTAAEPATAAWRIGDRHEERFDLRV